MTEQSTDDSRDEQPSGRKRSVHQREPLDSGLLALARRLRETETDPERLLWKLLRGRRFMGCKFRRQHPVAPYVLDFYCHEARLGVELDGGQHGEPAGEARDKKRTAYLNEQGIRVVRFWNNDVLARTEPVLLAIRDGLVEQAAAEPDE